MSATKNTKKKSVSTPLHLLHQLSGSLLEHLEDACSRALIDAEKLLGKLEKQRGKAQEKLHNARVKLQDAAVAELEELLDTLKGRQSETRDYIVGLKRDAQESLKLAQGVGKVKEAASKALGRREAKPAVAKPVAAKAPAAKAAAKPAASKA